jgi:hypothetical protein
MSDISVTAASVVANEGATRAEGTAGGTITAGQPIYKDASDGYKLKAADTNASSASAAAVGIALHAALAGQPIEYITAGVLTLNAVLTVGETYIVSATAGGIAPVGDSASGWYTTHLGIGLTTSTLLVKPLVSGVAKA